MNIKMKAKENKNLKTKIGLKNLLVSKNKTSFKPKRINIQTINVQKNFNYFNSQKDFFSSKKINNIRYIHNSSLNNYNTVTKNDYFLDKNRNSFFNSFDSERDPSPIDSVASSPYVSSGKKNFFKRRRYNRRINNKKKNKYNNINDKYKISNKNNSIHNLSFNTNSNTNNTYTYNTNISYINSSCSSSLDNYHNENNNNDYDYSDSSEASYKSRENKRKKYMDKMMVEENELDYLKRSEVGLISTDEEDNNNSMENSNSIEENFNNEIERILIEIYNKNISLISSGNSSDISKNSGEIQDIEKQIKKYLKRENLKTNLLVLKSLGNKIKELIGKYKEKVYEIDELKTLQKALQRQIYKNNNSVESNVATNSNSNGSYNNSYIDDETSLKNNLTLNSHDEINEKGIPHILLRELINIKRTLKISSKEIEGIFKYPLNILKDENGKKIKFSIELMQREEFCKILLNDDIISTLLSQIKDMFKNFKNLEIKKWLVELDENYEHNDEMTRFISYINDKLLIKNKNNNTNENNNYLDELKFNKEKNVMFEQINNEEILKKEIEELNKKIKRKKNKKNEKLNKQEEQIDELKFKDIDEILNYINDDTDSKKGKKKNKKTKKNKNKKLKEEEKENQIKQDKNNFNENEDSLKFEKEFQNFKEDLIKDTMYFYEINNKIKPCLSESFLDNISII